jgi:hypothetical protein
VTRNLRPPAALAMLALLSAACSSSAPAETSTSGTGGADSTTTQAMQFSECMRDNGIDEFPDPNASGELTIDGVLNGSSLDGSSAAFARAMTACKDLEPAGFTGLERNAQQQLAALAFAQCIRDNGVDDFPDPTPDSPLIDTNRIPSTAREGGMDALHAATQRCRGQAAAAGVTDR